MEGLIFLGDREDHQARTGGQLIQHLFSFLLGHQEDFGMVEVIELLGQRFLLVEFAFSLERDKD